MNGPERVVDFRRAARLGWGTGRGFNVIVNVTSSGNAGRQPFISTSFHFVCSRMAASTLCGFAAAAAKNRADIRNPTTFVLFQGYHYFSPSVSFSQISDSLRDFTQSVTFVNDRYNLSGPHELAYDCQVVLAWSRRKKQDLLVADEP